MSVMSIANAHARQFLNSKSQRTHTENGNKYVLEFVRDTYDRSNLICTTWGYDYAELRIPQEYTELVMLRNKAKLGILQSTVPQDVAIRFYERIFRKVNA